MPSSSFRSRLLLQMLNKQQKRRNSASGFTLIELLVVIVILGALSAIGWAAYVNQLARANYNAAAIDALQAAKACVASAVVATTAITCSATYTASAGQGTYSRSASVTVNTTTGEVGGVTPFAG